MGSVKQAEEITKQFRSLEKIADSLGYAIESDIEFTEYAPSCEFVLIKKKHKKSLGTMLAIQDQESWDKSFPIIFADCLDDLANLLSCIAVEKEIGSIICDGATYSLVKLDKWSVKQIRNRD